MAKNTDLLDITDWSPSFGLSRDQMMEEFCMHIVNCVKSTQMFVIQPLPNILLMTREQFDFVKPDADFQPTDELIWKTKDPNSLNPRTGAPEILNMMDVHVKGEFEPTPPSLLLFR
jgi:hypothetical protein